ncbi:MAG: two component transcriptional regulator, winged helix family [Bryobacterales bacterium]|jgi:DNA-binding response OmpR family regulator|nr:two component transcriptional regulator, winged helix family [Bryobacterales bacterium]
MSVRVLVVDDDPDQVIVRCMLLSHHGFETRRASDPDAAMKAAREDVPEIVVVDLGLPTERDGLRLIAELKAAYPTVDIVVLTGSSIQRLKSSPELEDVAYMVQKGSPSKALLGILSRIAAARVS